MTFTKILLITFLIFLVKCFFNIGTVLPLQSRFTCFCACACSSRPGFSTPVYFCEFDGRDLLHDGPCDPIRFGWRPNFELYGGANQTSNAIRLYHYHNTVPGYYSSNLFTTDDIMITGLEATPKSVYIPAQLQSDLVE